MDNLESVSEKLKSAKLKVTPQRIAIYKLLLETRCHPTAETIYNSLKEQYPTMSIATVYKNLITLKKSNLIQELNLRDASLHYDANVNFHSHLICTCCSSVYDYDLPIISDVYAKIKADTDFDTENTQLYFYGKCKNCKN